MRKKQGKSTQSSQLLSRNSATHETSLPDSDENGNNSKILELAEQLSRLDEGELQKLAIVQRLRVTHSSYSGPLPSPEALQGYEKAHPGLAERITAMAEKEQDHRHKTETQLVANEAKKIFRGQIIGGGIALCAMILTGVTAYFGHDAVAGIVGGTTIVGLCSIFVLGRTFKPAKEENELDEKP